MLWCLVWRIISLWDLCLTRCLVRAQTQINICYWSVMIDIFIVSLGDFSSYWRLMNVNHGVSAGEPTACSTNFLVKMLNEFSAWTCDKQNSLDIMLCRLDIDFFFFLLRIYFYNHFTCRREGRGQFLLLTSSFMHMMYIFWNRCIFTYTLTCKYTILLRIG